MKYSNYFKLVILVLFILLSGTRAKAQNLLDSLEGKWKVIEYKTKSKLKAKTDTIIFQSDGIYISDSTYLNSTKGFYRTDENRSIVLMEANSEKTEWQANLNKGILTLNEVSSKKGAKSKLKLTRIVPSLTSTKHNN